jgi:hypothetical protein
MLLCPDLRLLLEYFYSDGRARQKTFCILCYYYMKPLQTILAPIVYTDIKIPNFCSLGPHLKG